MPSNIKNTTSTGAPSTVPAKSAGDPVSADTLRKMLDVLDELTDHTHVFYDDYSTACQCACNCDCGRGIL